MIVQQIELKRAKDGDFENRSIEDPRHFEGYFWVCGERLFKVLHKWFNVPANASKLWLSLHDRKARERVKVKIERDFKDESCLRKVGTRSQVGYWKFDRLLKPFEGRTLWFQVEYEL